MDDMPAAARDLFWRLLNQLDGRLPAQERASVQEAGWRCARSHTGQTRDDGSPYLLHPLRVALILVEEFGVTDAAVVRAALLHDVLEDDLTMNQEALESSFGATTAALVAALTKSPRGSRSRQEANAEYFSRLADGAEDARVVKLADKLDNLRDAANCPSVEKRERTAAEARQLLGLLPPSLSDRALGERVARLMAEALEGLERLG